MHRNEHTNSPPASTHRIQLHHMSSRSRFRNSTIHFDSKSLPTKLDIQSPSNTLGRKYSVCKYLDDVRRGWFRFMGTSWIASDFINASCQRVEQQRIFPSHKKAANKLNTDDMGFALSWTYIKVKDNVLNKFFKKEFQLHSEKYIYNHPANSSMHFTTVLYEGIVQLHDQEQLLQQTGRILENQQQDVFQILNTFCIYNLIKLVNVRLIYKCLTSQLRCSATH